MAIKCKLSLFGFTCLLFLALGCAEIKEFYHGNTVSSVPVIVLQEGTPNAGRWETFDLIIDYEYILASLTQHYQMLYTSIPRMVTYIFFLDEDSRVLETASFINLWTDSTRDIQVFSKNYIVPDRTKKISIGYSGEAQGKDMKSSFYELPLR
jgi:hypothetical protein